jgi:hypothetical protein
MEQKDAKVAEILLFQGHSWPFASLGPPFTAGFTCGAIAFSFSARLPRRGRRAENEEPGLKLPSAT